MNYDNQKDTVIHAKTEKTPISLHSLWFLGIYKASALPSGKYSRLRITGLSPTGGEIPSEPEVHFIVQSPS